MFRSRRRPFSRFACPLAGCALAAIPAVAIAQEAQAPTADGAADQLTQDQRPAPEGDILAVKSLFQLFFGVKTAPGSGPNGSIRTVTTDTFKLRADRTISLSPDWQLALRGDLPFLAKNPLNSGNPNADYLYGVGDADVQAALIHDIDARWKAGFGARLIMPTGDDNLGSGKWQVMPIVGARYSMPDVGYGMYIEPLLRYDVSFAGDPSRKSVNNLQFAPEVNFSFPGIEMRQPRAESHTPPFPLFEPAGRAPTGRLSAFSRRRPSRERARPGAGPRRRCRGRSRARDATGSGSRLGPALPPP